MTSNPPTAGPRNDPASPPPSASPRSSGSTPSSGSPPSSVSLHLPFDPDGSGATDGDLVTVTPQTAGWTFSGLRVLRLSAGVPRRVATGNAEVFVLPLSGSVSVTVAHQGEPDRVEASFDLAGRRSVFTRVSDFAYAGRDCLLTLSSAEGAEVALPSAVCERRREARYGAAQDVPVELRGAGPATRQVNNFGVPGVWDHAEKLIAVEVLTPPGNWSSYPAHKHDASEPCPLVIEEIYHYRIGGPDQVTPSRQGFGLHRTYTGPEHERAGLAPIDVAHDVRDHDVVLVPHGYHGPCVAAPGYPMYYLNVMAGPAVERAWAFCDDPAHAWVRGTWDGLPTDPRLPLTGATELPLPSVPPPSAPLPSVPPPSAPPPTVPPPTAPPPSAP